MKKYKLLKKFNSDNIDREIGCIIEIEIDFLESTSDEWRVDISFLIQEGYLEEIKERFISQGSGKPKFKVNDRVNMGTYYGTVIGVDIKPKTSELDEYIYYLSGLDKYEIDIWEENLRTPTDEEVDIYY